jgi:hypothetical protein
VITLRNLITHCRIEIYNKKQINDTMSRTGDAPYGAADVYLGPGDSYYLGGIPINFNVSTKILYMRPLGEGAPSKALFDKDIAPICYAAIEKIKETFGKLEYDTIYLVTADKAVKEPEEVKGLDNEQAK